MLTLSPTPQGPWGRGGNRKRATMEHLPTHVAAPRMTPYVSKWPSDQKEFGDGGGGHQVPPGTSTATLVEAPPPGGKSLPSRPDRLDHPTPSLLVISMGN